MYCFLQTLGFLKQRVTLGANDYVMRCRAMYRVANLPREYARFYKAVSRALETTKLEAIKSMDGWSIRKRDAFTAFSILGAVDKQMLEYFQDVMKNISGACIGAGSNFSVVVTRGGCGWAFGAGTYGQIGQGTLVRLLTCLRRAAALLQRPLVPSITFTSRKRVASATLLCFGPPSHVAVTL
jgi:hypothetical protein